MNIRSLRLAGLGAALVLLAGLVFCQNAGPGAASARDAAPGAPASARTHASSTEPVRVLWMDGVENAYPRWSNDGRRILFQSNRDGGKWQLYIMDADGSHQRRLTDGKHNDNFPDWSPDNQWVAFVSDRGGDEDVYVMRMDGSGLRNLSHHPARDIHPYWSPDGRRILFNSTRHAGHFQIYSIRPDGSGFRRLSDSPDEQTCVRISPAGDRMVYLANLVEGRDDIIVADSIAQHPVNVTHDAAPDGWPVWTADGLRIVYSKQTGGPFALYSMKPDGSDVRRLTDPGPGWNDARACVSRDMKRIVFNRAREGTIGIFVMPYDARPMTEARRTSPGSASSN